MPQITANTNHRFSQWPTKAIFFPIQQPISSRGRHPRWRAQRPIKFSGQNINSADYIRTKMRCRYIHAQINHKTNRTKTDSVIGA